MTRTTTRVGVHWVVAACALVLVCGPNRASQAGDDPDKRRELLRQIEDKVDDMAEALARLPGDSSDRPIDDARVLASDVKRLAEQLEDVAGDDSTAKAIADKYPDDMDEYVGVVPYLRALKQGQNHAQPEAQMCAERDKELVRQARDFGSRNDPDGLTELPKLAVQYLASTQQALEGARRDDDKLEAAEEEADDYAADGGLRAVDSAIATAARQLYAAGHKSEESAEEACANLLKGADHPDVKEALAGLANSAGGRKAIIDQLDKDARALASTLAGVSEDSGLGSVERARSLLGEIERGVDNLGRSSTTDKATKLIVEKWPEGIRQLKDALDDLEDLKLHQHDLDALPSKCEQKLRDLRDAVGKNADDPDGIDDLQKLADELAEPVRAGLVRADERLKEEEADRERAKAISFSEGPWGDVRAAEQRDADETFRTYEDGHHKTTDACADVIKGKDGPIVNEAIQRLRRSAATTGDALDRDVATWLEAARRTYILDCKKMEELWQAYCGTDFEPGDSGADEPAQQIAAKLQDEMQREMTKLLDELKRLSPRVDALVGKRETKARGEVLRAAIDQERKRLDRLEDQGTWRGQNNPLSQYANRYGNDRHKAEWSGKGCQVPISDTGYAVFTDAPNYQKPDCIIAKPGQCEIWEFKPNSAAARDEGDKQVAEYERYVPRYYTDKHRKNEAPSSNNGGMDFLAELRKYCLDEDSDEIVFKTVDVKPYNMCDKQYVCESN